MSIVYCDYCNYSATSREWDGDVTPEGENVCSQCEFDGIMAATLEFERGQR